MGVVFNTDEVSSKVRLLAAIEDGTVRGADDIIWLTVLESLQWIFNGWSFGKRTVPMFVTCDQHGAIRLCSSNDDWAIQMRLDVTDNSPLEPACGTIRIGRGSLVTVVDESDIRFEYLFEKCGVSGDIVRMHSYRHKTTSVFENHLRRTEEYFLSCIRDELVREITKP